MPLYFCRRCHALFVEQDWDQKHDCCNGCAPQSKYRNRKTTVDGILFDSQKEANCYQELLFRVQAGEIRDLVLQPTFRLVVNGELITQYTADFQYVEVASGERKVIDVKSVATRKERAYRIIRRLMKALNGIVIIEM